MNFDVRKSENFEEGVRQVVMGIKKEIENRDNSLIYMKFKTFLGKFGYERRSNKLLNIVDECLNEYNIVVVNNSTSNQEVNWDDLSYDENITFKFENQVINNNAGKIKVASGDNPFNLYLHQQEAIKSMNRKYKRLDSFSGMLAIPTGGGKTLTAMQWLLRNAIGRNKKVLWIAHRHELLNQAFSALNKNAFSDLVKNIKDFRYRIISGQHDRPVNIQNNDDFIIASKDSLYCNMDYLINNWANSEEEIFLVVDEAHHATAKTYRKVINEVKNKVSKFNLLGLTATPFRSSDKEQGLLKKIFKDDILYKVDLEQLINRGILSAPIFKEYNTELNIHRELTDQDVKNIQSFDLKGDIAKKIASSKERNNRIVSHYIENKNKYGKLLVFTIDIDHAITLNKLFNRRGVSSEYIVSSIKNVHGVSVSQEDNQRKVKRFREGEVDVLVNVNILTEGVDLPDVETVFLTRPTISSILMTQMIGRALRGQKAGGTEEAYIVSFIDNWRDKINWVNPEKLYIEENVDFNNETAETREKLIRLISIEKIEEFASMMDDSIDTSRLEAIDFLERIPIGLYSFSVLVSNKKTREDMTKNCEVLVYDDMHDSYKEFINELERLFDFNNLNSKEKLSGDELEELCNEVENEFFIGKDFTLDYKREDIKDILRYYAFKGVEPRFYEFKNRKKFDLSKEAKYIFENDLGGREEANYINDLWDSEEKSWWKILFNHNKDYFISQLSKEKKKLQFPNLIDGKNENPKVEYDLVELENLSMSELRKKAPKHFRKLHNAVYARAKDEEGYYNSAISDFRSKSKLPFQIDHIIPMSKGGKTTLDNLQLLTKKENAKKSDNV
ncbi:DEAD/DEAH box helicase family protein [Halanaerobacter jeridensis]|uniref:Superfamily II DNA or RNA helicase n=1 Tax=Halanaerobacter jeridensis TaxID=706427 RepID=A0A938XQM9_9FIRM|nr:DEAD/DEAH box helicase family protein [Halanaerobacter jeridensis]MBM7558118.1 superfamily II DNA or RNA helicase [Halanaerobacter jeridensis]